MFKIEFLGSLDNDVKIFQSSNIEQVLKFFQSINWLKNLHDGYDAQDSEEYIQTNDYWYCIIENTKENTSLNIFIENIDGRKTILDNLKFVIEYSWENTVKTSFIEKLFTRKSEKNVVETIHSSNVNYHNLLNTVNYFVYNDIISLKNFINVEGCYDFDVSY
jgi:hypothetical protein